MIVEESLYQQIIKVMPIPCVDLIVEDDQGKILLLKRKNKPASGEWWFPGGRIFHGESMIATAQRKLKEECGLKANEIIRLFTIEIIIRDCEPPFHAISTLFHIVSEVGQITLDSQSLNGEWRTLEGWVKKSKDSLAITILKGVNSFHRNGRFPQYLTGLLHYNPKN